MKVTDHGSHLRLLQHDFGDPDPIGITGELPGKVLPSVGIKPTENLRLKMDGVWHWRQRVLV